MDPRMALAELEIIFYQKLTQVKLDQAEDGSKIHFGELDKAVSILERITKLQQQTGAEDLKRSESLAKAQRLPRIPRRSA